MCTRSLLPTWHKIKRSVSLPERYIFCQHKPLRCKRMYELSPRQLLPVQVYQVNIYTNICIIALVVSEVKSVSSLGMVLNIFDRSVAPQACPVGSYTSEPKTTEPGPGVFPQCTICPPGYYCTAGSVAPTPCGLGYHSSQGSTACEICPKGYFCASTTTSTNSLMTSAGFWFHRGAQFGRCYNGTYCPRGMTTEPTLDLHACPKGYYCPMATPDIVPCPAGTVQMRINIELNIHGNETTFCDT
jgi:hypothetical protein